MSNQPQPQPPQLITKSNDIHGESNFTQGCTFSPDGLCVLTSTASDNTLRLYNVPPPQKRDDDLEGGEGVSRACDANGGTESTSTKTMSSSMDMVVHPWRTALSAREGDRVRCYAWYPKMNSYDPATCAFLSVSRDQPIHLIDAYTSKIRASYRPHNALDEMESPQVLAFSPEGDRIAASGFKSDRTIHIFRTDLPGGRESSDVWRLGKTRRSSDGQKGLVSALAFSSGGGGNVVAVGTYSPGSIYLYDDRRASGWDNPVGTILHGGLCVVGRGRGFARKKRRFWDVTSSAPDSTVTNGDAHVDRDSVEDLFSTAKVNWYQSRARGGITQLSWSPSPYASDFALFSASRHSDAVLAWDARVLSGCSSHSIQGIRSYARDGDTNQKLEFDFDELGQNLFVASRDRTVKVYDVKSGELVRTIGGFDDSVNGVSYHKGFGGGGGGLLAVSTGARRFEHNYEDEDDKVEDSKRDRFVKDIPPGSLELYSI